MGSLICDLHELDERTGERRRMDKGDAMASASDSRGLVDQPDALGTEVSEGVLDVGDGKGDMMEALAPAFEEAADRGLWGEEPPMAIIASSTPCSVITSRLRGSLPY
jgi:hypothetical protein